MIHRWDLGLWKDWLCARHAGFLCLLSEVGDSRVLPAGGGEFGSSAAIRWGVKTHPETTHFKEAEHCSPIPLG